MTVEEMVELAENLLGWKQEEDKWIDGEGKFTGYFVARRKEDRFENKFWRPDSHYRCWRMLWDKLKEKLGTEHTFSWKGFQFTGIFQTGEVKTRATDICYDSMKSNEVNAECLYHHWKQIA